MAYTSPTTRSTGNAISASNWNTDLVDNIKWLAAEHPCSRVYNNTNFSHSSSGSYVAVTFNSEDYDIGSCHSTASNTSRLTVPTGGDGKYDIFAHFIWDSNTTGARACFFRKNGTTAIGGKVFLPASLGTTYWGFVCTQASLAAADYVEFMVYQDSGGTRTGTYEAGNGPVFGWNWISV